MQALVNVSWDRDADGRWAATLLTSSPDGLERFPLTPGARIEREVGPARRCIGAFTGIGVLEPCPDFAALRAGSQCATCRNRDVYADYVIGQGAANVDAAFAVYLAQCGQTVKVGVTRERRLERRWVEQGADHAAVLETGLSSEQALEYEQEISAQGVPQRVRKEDKLSVAPSKLSTVLDRLGRDAAITDVQSNTVYGRMPCRSVVRTGRVAGEVRAVKGQIVAVEQQCLAVTSGRVIREPVQQGLADF